MPKLFKLYCSFVTPQNSHSQKWQWQHSWILFIPWNPGGCSQTSPVSLKSCPTTTVCPLDIWTARSLLLGGTHTGPNIITDLISMCIICIYLEVCVIHTRVLFCSLHFSLCSAEDLSDHYKQLFWFHCNCSDFIPVLRGQCGTKSGNVLGFFRWFFAFLTFNTWRCFFFSLYSIWNHGKPLFPGLWNFKNEKKERGKILIAGISLVQ